MNREGVVVKSWTRRARMARTVMALAILASGVTFTLGCTAPPTARVTPPNVLVIVADDLGFSDVGVLGGEIPTPAIDSLAESGVLMTNFHVAATCSPTRAMLLSGADNHRAGLGNMGEFLSEEQVGQPGYEGHLSHDVTTLATRLRSRGYATAMVGKWHLGDGPDERPHARGFDRTFALMGGSGSAWDDKSAAPIIGERTHFTRDGRSVERGPGFSATRYVDEVIDFVDSRSDDEPFFAYLAFQAIHWPHHAPDEHLAAARGRYDAGWRAVWRARIERQRALGLFPAEAAPARVEVEVPRWDQLSDAQRRDEAARMEAYAAMAMAMDAEIGRLVEHLEARSELDETLVVFVSDNGADPSEPERSAQARAWYEARYPRTAPDELGLPGSFPSTGFGWARVSVAPLATHKGQPGEGGLRVPFIARYPGRIPAGSRSGAFGYATDLVPTILEAVARGSGDEGAGSTEGIDGRSLYRVMTGEAARAHAEDESIGYELMGNAALFRGDLKLVRPHGKPWKLFDILRDPGETRDLALDRPDDFDRMVRAYAEYETRMGIIPVPADYDVMKQLLRASGAEH